MNKKRQKKLYLLLVLLIMLIVAIIGALATALFNMQFTSSDKQKVSDQPQLHTNTVTRVTPTSEKYIEAEPAEKPEAPPERVESAAMVTPRVCDGYGPQIKSRAPYKHPATYTATVTPGHVRFVVYPQQSSSSESSH